MNKTRFIDLFSGIGGFHLALKNTNSECVFASEWDRNCQEIYEKNFNIRPCGDITKIDTKDIPSHDLLCAGFPCQAFSISGKRLGFNETRGTLFFDVARIVKFHKPKVVFLENVKNFLKHDNGKTIQVVTSTLENLNYDVFYSLLNSSNYGIPQSRERIYIVAFRRDLNIKEFSFPKPINKPVSLIDFLLPDKLTKELVIKRKDIFLEKNKKIQKDMFDSYPQKAFRVGHINKGGQGERIYSPLGHSIALTAYGGGIGSKTGLYLINKKIRKLAPRECARIFGFPDSFQIHEKKSVCYSQFGNSVVVNVIKLIVEKIFHQIKNNPKIK
jgi:DNA (cytosine-5)-methyltransferase 1